MQVSFIQAYIFPSGLPGRLSTVSCRLLVSSLIFRLVFVQLAERRLNRTLFARLRPKATGTGKQNAGAFCVGTYHMPCMFLVPPVMTIHASMAIQHFAQLAGSDPLVFAGDFNFTPQSECYKLVTEG